MARVPLGVAFLATLNLLTGILILMGSGPLFGEFTYLILGYVLKQVQYGSIILGLIYIMLGIGLLTLSRWAWYGDIIFGLFNLLIIILGVIAPGGPLGPGNISWITLILNLIIVLYLNQEGIRRKFDV